MFEVVCQNVWSRRTFIKTFKSLPKACAFLRKARHSEDIRVVSWNFNERE